eukprot:5286-Hanusia_phi.AAC.4
MDSKGAGQVELGAVKILRKRLRERRRVKANEKVKVRAAGGGRVWVVEGGRAGGGRWEEVGEMAGRAEGESGEGRGEGGPCLEDD